MNTAITQNVVLAACTTLLTSCATRPHAPPPRGELIRLLEHEARSNTGWVRVHAADALLDHGWPRTPALLFAVEADTAAPPYRIGVWRVMARAAETPARRRAFAERIRRDLLDLRAPDRLHAAESLAKLGLSNPADRPVLELWLADAPDAASAYTLWLLTLSSRPYERAAIEDRLANLLDSTDVTARLRAAFALGRLRTISAAALCRLKRQAELEPRDSPARPYLLAAELRHAPRHSTEAAHDARQLSTYLAAGRPNEQLEAAATLGLCGATELRPALVRLLQSPDADARIGAADGLLYLLR